MYVIIILSRYRYNTSVISKKNVESDTENHADIICLLHLLSSTAANYSILDYVNKLTTPRVGRCRGCEESKCILTLIPFWLVFCFQLGKELVDVVELRLKAVNARTHVVEVAVEFTDARKGA